jgi:hypothetical protein
MELLSIPKDFILLPDDGSKASFRKVDLFKRLDE